MICFGSIRVFRVPFLHIPSLEPLSVGKTILWLWIFCPDLFENGLMLALLKQVPCIVRLLVMSGGAAFALRSWLARSACCTNGYHVFDHNHCKRAGELADG